MEVVDIILQKTFWGETTGRWFQLLASVLILFFIFRFLWAWFLVKAKNLANRSAFTWDDRFIGMLGKTSTLFLLTLFLFLGHRLLNFSGQTYSLFSTAAKFGIFLQLAVWGNEALTILLRSYIGKRSGDPSNFDQVELSAYSALGLTAKFVLWTFLLIVLLDNLGVNISALITGLGIGGIAVALALQNILGDIFASLSIVMDRPFEVGDFIIIGDKMGVVESIGLKTSRIKSLSGEQLVFPNRKLVESEVQNFKRMQHRRVVFRFGVVYDSSPEQLERIPRIVREIFDGLGNAVVDRIHCCSFAESSIDYELVYIMQTADYNAYMDVQQAFNFRLFQRFQDESIGFAFPTRTLHIQSGGQIPE